MKDTGEDALIERLERVTVRDEVGDWADVRRRAERLGTRRRRVRAPRLVAFAAAALALVAIAAPALGLHEPVVRFFEGEPAPEDVQIDFATLDQGVPTPEWRTGPRTGLEPSKERPARDESRPRPPSAFRR